MSSCDRAGDLGHPARDVEQPSERDGKRAVMPRTAPGGSTQEWAAGPRRAAPRSSARIRPAPRRPLRPTAPPSRAARSPCTGTRAAARRCRPAALPAHRRWVQVGRGWPARDRSGCSRCPRAPATSRGEVGLVAAVRGRKPDREGLGGRGVVVREEVSALESSPPDRKSPVGTSAIRWRRTDAFSSSRSCSSRPSGRWSSRSGRRSR